MDLLVIYLLMLLGTVYSDYVHPSNADDELYVYRSFKPLSYINSLHVPSRKAAEYHSTHKNSKKYPEQFPMNALEPHNTMKSRSKLLSPEEKLNEFLNVPSHAPLWELFERYKDQYRDIAYHNEHEQQDSGRKSFQKYISVPDSDQVIVPDWKEDLILISNENPFYENGNDEAQYEEDSNVRKNEILSDHYTEDFEVPMLEQHTEFESIALKPKVTIHMHREIIPQQERILSEPGDKLLGSKGKFHDKLTIDVHDNLAKQNYEVNAFEKSLLKWPEELLEPDTIQMLPPVYENLVEMEKEQQEEGGHSSEEKLLIMNPEVQIREVSFDGGEPETFLVPQSVSEYHNKAGEKEKLLDRMIIPPADIAKDTSPGFIQSVNTKPVENSPATSVEIPVEEIEEQEAEKRRNVLIPEFIDQEVPAQLKFTNRIFPRITAMKSAVNFPDADTKKESRFIPESSAGSIRQFPSKGRRQIIPTELSEVPVHHKVRILPQNSLDYSPCSIRIQRTPGVRPGEIVIDLYYKCNFLPFEIHQQLITLKSDRKHKMVGYRYEIFKGSDLRLNEQPKHYKIDSILNHVAEIFARNIIKLLRDNEQKNITDGQPIQILEEITSGKRHISVNVMPLFDISAEGEKLHKSHGNNNDQIKRLMQDEKPRNLIKKFCDNLQKQSKNPHLKKFRMFCSPIRQFELFQEEPVMSGLDNQKNERNSQNNQISGNVQPRTQQHVNAASQAILPNEKTTEGYAAVPKPAKHLEIHNHFDPIGMLDRSIYFPEHEPLSVKKSDEKNFKVSVRYFPSYSASNEMIDEYQDETLNHPPASADHKSFETPFQPLIYIQKLPEKPLQIYSSAQERAQSTERKANFDFFFKKMAELLSSDMEFKKLGHILTLLQENGVKFSDSSYL